MKRAIVAVRSPVAQIALGQSDTSFPAVGTFWNDSDSSPIEQTVQERYGVQTVVVAMPAPT